MKNNSFFRKIKIIGFLIVSIFVLQTISINSYTNSVGDFLSIKKVMATSTDLCSAGVSSTNGICATCYNSNSNTDNCLIENQSGSSSPTCTQKSCNFVSNYINPTINLLSSIVGLVIVASIIVGGIQYSSSGGDPQKAAKAKTRITNSLIAFLAFIFLYAFLQFIIPGGLLSQSK